MKILLDDNLPHKLRGFLPGHEAITVAYLNWIGIRNGQLIKAAEAAGFDVLVTTDQGIPHQQNMTGMKIALVVLSTPDWNVVRKHVEAIAAAVGAAKPGTLTRIAIWMPAVSPPGDDPSR